LWLTQQIGDGRILATSALREGTTDATTARLASRLPSRLRNDFAVSSLVGKRNTRPIRSRLEYASFVNELLMSTRTKSAAGIGREFLLA
jgi:hypothetical protein